MDWIESLVLGVVQGLTEFLPISSDGHLNLTQHAFAAATGRPKSEADKIFFDVMLHVGTLLAIVAHYRDVAREGARDLLAGGSRRMGVVRVGILAAVATAPLVLDKLFFLKLIEEAFHSLTATGVGFLITAAVLLVNTRLKGGSKDAATTGWADALLVGIAQMFAPLPGVSRSGLTIAAALALGFSRAWAVGFSLLIAVPAIIGATVFEVRKVNPASLTPDRVAQIVASAAVAGVIGFLAINWLVRLVRAGRIWYFSVYLVALGLGVIALDQLGKGGGDGQPSHTVDRPLRGGPPIPGHPGGGAGAVGGLAGDLPFGPRPDPPVAGDRGGRDGGRPPGLDLVRRLAGGRGGEPRPPGPALPGGAAGGARRGGPPGPA